MITDTSLHVTYNSKAKSTLLSMPFSSSMGSISGEGCGVRRWQWLMKLTGECGHSCLMYCCSPHRISWTPRGECWVFHHKFTQLFTHRVSVVNQQAHFDVVRCAHSLYVAIIFVDRDTHKHFHPMKFVIEV